MDLDFRFPPIHLEKNRVECKICIDASCAPVRWVCFAPPNLPCIDFWMIGRVNTKISISMHVAPIDVCSDLDMFAKDRPTNVYYAADVCLQSFPCG